MKKEKYRNILIHRKWKIDKALLFILLVLFNLSFFCYFFALQYETVQQLIMSKTRFIFLILMSIFSTLVSTNVIVFARMSCLQRIFSASVGVLYLLLIFFVDQGTTEDEFRYGYWSSRGYLYLFLGLEGCFLFFYFVITYLCIKLKLQKLFIVLVGVIVSFVFLHVILLYTNRKAEFEKGAFGKAYDPSLFKCHIDVDTFLGSRLFPRFMFQKFLTTYWCYTDEEFVTLDPPSKDYNNVTLEIDCINEPIELQFLKSISRTNDHFTFEEMRSPGNYGQFPITRLQKNILRRSKKVYLPPSEQPQRYTYSSLDFETVQVLCGFEENHNRSEFEEPKDYTKGNIIVHPGKRFEDEELRTLSLYDPNLIILFFDSESRKSFESNFPKSLEFIERVIMEEKNDEDVKKFVVNEFFAHHVVGWNTLPQSLAMFNGYLREYGGEMRYDEPWEKEGIKDKKYNSGIYNKPIWELIKTESSSSSSLPYLTVFSSDECNEWSTLYNGNMMLCDHVHVEPFCFPKFTDPDKPIQSFKGPFAAARKCLFQKEAPEYVFDYLKKMEEVYPKNAKFMIGMFLDAHEATGETGRYLDDHLLEYLTFLVDERVLDQSVVFFLGDHGNHMSILSNLFFKEGDVGGRNPALLTITPSRYLHEILEEEEEEVVMKRLERNENGLITAFDLHRTWCDIVGIDGVSEWNKRGLNIFVDEIPGDRNCEMAGIPYGTLCKNLLCDNVT